MWHSLCVSVVPCVCVHVLLCAGEYVLHACVCLSLQADVPSDQFVLRHVEQLCRVGTLANIQSISATPEGMQVGVCVSVLWCVSVLSMNVLW